MSEQIGKFLFRWRSYLPLVFIAGILAEVYFLEDPAIIAHRTLWWQLCCLTIVLVGEGIRFYVSGTVPVGTSGRGTKALKADTLNTDGFYSIVRHPLYLGNFFMWIGASLFFQRWYIAFTIGIIFLLYYRRIIVFEEQFLVAKFGKEFEIWSRKVSALIPTVKNYIPAKLPFKIKSAIKKEHDSIFAVIVIFYCFEMMRVYKVNEEIKFYNVWFYPFAISLLIWVVLKLMKKLHWLDVAGR